MCGELSAAGCLASNDAKLGDSRVAKRLFSFDALLATAEDLAKELDFLTSGLVVEELAEGMELAGASF